MANCRDYLHKLQTYDASKVPSKLVKKVESLFASEPEFSWGRVKKQSKAAADLLGWVMDVVNYHNNNKKREEKNSIGF